MTVGSSITEERVEVDGVGVHVRRTEGEGAPVVFAHGNPTDSRDWLPFLEHLARPAIAFDFPGWGLSEHPSTRRFDFSMHGLARFFGTCLDRLGVSEHALVVHDWGGLALIEAIRRSEQLDALVVINSVPLLPGYRWHWLARYFWRVPVLGELGNATTTKASLRLIGRQSNARPGAMPGELMNTIWDGWRRAGRMRLPMLRLYRSGDPEALAAAGSGLERIECPALVVWGAKDPYLPRAFGTAYAERLPNAELVEIDRAGHWPWLDQPEVVVRVTDFLNS